MGLFELCKKNKINLYLLTILLTLTQFSYAQVKQKLTWPDSLSPNYEFSPEIKFQMPFDYMYRSTTKEDESNIRVHGHLINQLPNSKNFEAYYELACSLWELEKLQEAKKMFLNIINSNEKPYSEIYYHNSDIPGDATTNIYGYGSYTSSYKNSAAVYLSKIYIELKEFDKAFSYLEDAKKKYKVQYNCGTGHYQQQDRYNYFYGRIYEGQKKYDLVLDLLLPECLTRNDQISVRAIQALYTKKQIIEKLQQAEKSLQCTFDTIPSTVYTMTYNSETKTEMKDTLTYYGGSATLILFDRKVSIIRPSLEEGGRISKETFIEEFRESSFYTNLSSIE